MSPNYANKTKVLLGTLVILEFYYKSASIILIIIPIKYIQ